MLTYEIQQGKYNQSWFFFLWDAVIWGSTAATMMTRHASMVAYGLCNSNTDYFLNCTCILKVFRELRPETSTSIFLPRDSLCLIDLLCVYSDTPIHTSIRSSVSGTRWDPLADCLFSRHRWGHQL